MRIKLFAMAVLLAQGAISQKKTFDPHEFYPIERSHSFIAFSVTYMGYAEVRGNFENFNGTFRYDPDDITRTSISFMVHTNSIDTDLEWRDNDLKSPNWLDAEKFPSIRFTSKVVSPSPSGFSVVGDLTIRDVTKEIILEMNPSSGVIDDIRGDKQVILSGTYTLDRTEYGVVGKNWSRVKEGITGVSNEITIEFSMLGKRIQKENYSNWVKREERPPGRLYAAYKRGGIKEVFQEFEKLKSEGEVSSAPLNTVGYMLLKSELYSDAIAIFERNKDEFSDESNVYDSLGEAYAASGKLKKARAVSYTHLTLPTNREV